MTKRNCWTAALCLGLMLMGGHHLWAAEPERLQLRELKSKMAAEGWTQISDKVFERQLSETKVEHMGYGREGLAWMINDLTRRLEGLTREYESYPSEDLAKTIDQLSTDIANAKQELPNMPKGMSSITANVTGPSCSICYSATADASYLTSSQGVKAIAEAKFSSSCGYSGSTSAYAYARATLNGTTNTVSQSDPDSGTNITSTATATANGGSVSGIPCYSEANSSAVSSALGISYSTSDTNSLCPAVTLSVTMSGPSFAYFSTATCSTKTWSATVSGGATPYAYKWYYNGTQVGTGTSYSRSVCYNSADFTIQVTVTDSSNPVQTQSVSRAVNVSYEPDICGIDCNCGGPGQQICP